MDTTTDKRGTITDLMVNKNYSVTHISFKKGAVRGNHYHKETVQHDFVLKGRLQFRMKDRKSFERIDTIVSEGESIHIPAHNEHAYKALENSEIISICFGVRKGQDYEKDVFRLPISKKLL
jgi:quercetin dioxygenase-like cupin family protein